MIKIKRQCDLEGCNNPHFAKGFCKYHQNKRPDFKFPERKVSKPIPQKSEKAKVKGLMYTRKRNAFMKQKENLICPVSKYFIERQFLHASESTFFSSGQLKNYTTNEELFDWSRNIKTTELHHKAGRVGRLLLDSEYWLAVSRKGHEFIHQNPKFSYSKGWLIKSSTL